MPLLQFHSQDLGSDFLNWLGICYFTSGFRNWEKSRRKR
jgi:hypothetical protein